jgi:hypothetical protein
LGCLPSQTKRFIQTLRLLAAGSSNVAFSSASSAHGASGILNQIAGYTATLRINGRHQ